MTSAELSGRRVALVVPLGSTEQHGAHLPLGTDTFVAAELANRLARRRPELVVGPALPYGSSGEHAAFAGTLSVGQEALARLLVELGRSADFFVGLLFLCAHGGNSEALGRAVEQLVAEGRRVRSWSPPSPADRTDLHAGRCETSLMLHLAPSLVRPELARAGTSAPLEDLMAELRRGGVATVSANGVLGDPAGASAAEGLAILDRWTARLASDLEGWP